MEFLQNVLWLLIAYLIGSTPTGYIIAKRIRGLDIREHGSGNVGATNVFRVVGKKWGAIVLAIDILKGWLVTAILAPTATAFFDFDLALKQFYFGAAAIAGHTWTPWLKLKGGKGVATSAGVLLGIFPLGTILATLIWAVCFAVWRYVSLASIVSALSFPILLLIFYRDLYSFGAVFLITLILVGLLIYNHRSNIERLRRGEELRIEFGKKKNSSSTSS